MDGIWYANANKITSKDMNLPKVKHPCIAIYTLDKLPDQQKSKRSCNFEGKDFQKKTMMEE